MKNTFIINLIILIASVSLFQSEKTSSPLAYEQIHQELLEAIILVETQGDSTKVGDGGKAVGILQIHPIMVREVNNCAKKLSIKKKFTYEDRKSKTKSIEMFWIWAKCHHKTSTNEKIARNWNGGPNGYKYNSTKYYWGKVQVELKEIQRTR
jgi:hypothetical protein